MLMTILSVPIRSPTEIDLRGSLLAYKSGGSTLLAGNAAIAASTQFALIAYTVPSTDPQSQSVSVQNTR
jgi:hypothetical protein